MNTTDEPKLATPYADIAESPAAWWSSRLLRYNVGLVVSGITAFILYSIVFSVYSDVIVDGEMTIFTIVFQGVCYLICMGIANVCYLLGPVSERLLRPRNPPAYRRTAFAFGFWFSVALPFIIPTWLTLMVLFRPQSFHQ